MPAGNRDRVLAFFEAAPKDEWISSREVREALGLSDPMTSKTLKALREEGLLEAKAIPKDTRRTKTYKAGGPAAPWHYRRSKRKPRGQRLGVNEP